MNTSVKKTPAEMEAKMNEEYFNNKVNMTPATIKTIKSCLDGKHEDIVSKVLEVDGKPIIGIDYADGKPVASWVTDNRGRRITISQPESEKETNDTATKVLARLAKRIEKAEIKEKTTKEHQPDVTKTNKPTIRRVVGRDDRA